MFRKNQLDKHLKEGYEHITKGEIIDAKDSYLKGLSIDPANLTILNNLSQIYKMINEDEKAIGYSEILLQECNRVLENEKTEELLLLKVNALTTLNKEDEASGVIDEVLKINPTNILCLFQKAYYLEYKKEYEKAIGYLNRILAEDEYDVQALLSKGRNFIKLSKFIKAEECLNLVFEIEPKNKTAITLKAKLLKKKNNTTISPHDFMYKAIESFEMEEFEKSLAYFDKALDLDCRYDEIWYARGELLIRMGQINDAINSFEKAFEINPQSGGIVKKKEFFKMLNGMLKINKILGFE
ncbi:tetratricopeptide repeat protein [Methanobrevibacter sp.]|uniref:tetratricopeptide repeat protein n=1 Tax=Methanobrevibacter sp. TaxID=66852 RepID=UPI00388D572C